MKHSMVFFALFGLALYLRGQETTNSNDGASVTEDTKIIGSLNDGTPSPPPPKPELPVLTSKSAQTRLVDVVESPPMPGLPPVTGTVTQTVRLVEDPGLPDPPPPLPALSPDDPAVLARLAELRLHYRETRFVFISATVYNHSRTYFRCYTNGAADKKVTGWSNIDFNHFCGFATYQVKGADGEIKRYGFLMGINNMDTRKLAQLVAEQNARYQLPEIPELPELSAEGPAFVINEGEAGDRDTVEVVRGMHELYQVEGVRMEEAYQGRINAYQERKSYLLAHPPKPKNLTINYWRGSRPENKPQEGKP